MTGFVSRYLYGWFHFARYVWLARRKRHGAGKQRWLHAWKGACCARAVIDGQHRGSFPLWLRWAFFRYPLSVRADVIAFLRARDFERASERS